MVSVQPSHGVTSVAPIRSLPGSVRTAAANEVVGTGSGARVAFRCGADPTNASSRYAASSTVRAIGPAVERPPGPLSPLANGSRPRDGLSPTTPTVAAGIRIEPPASEAGAAGSMPVATAIAAPPEEPPAPVVGSHGLRAGSPAAGSV